MRVGFWPEDVTGRLGCSDVQRKDPVQPSVPSNTSLATRVHGTEIDLDRARSDARGAWEIL
jgi:hypothetical protein